MDRHANRQTDRQTDGQTDRQRNKMSPTVFPNSNFQKTTWYVIIGTILLATVMLTSFEFLSSIFHKGWNFGINNPGISKMSQLFSAFGYFVNQGQ